MKTFENFVNIVFTGKESESGGLREMTMADIQKIADNGDIYGLVDYFKDAAHQWRDQFFESIDPTELLESYPIEGFLEEPDPLMVNEGENRYEEASV